jgi:hypothetical protein
LAEQPTKELRDVEVSGRRRVFDQRWGARIEHSDHPTAAGAQRLAHASAEGWKCVDGVYEIVYGRVLLDGEA